MRALMMTTVISGWVLASAGIAAPPTGAYVFDTSPKYPDFTRVVISEKGGKLHEISFNSGLGRPPCGERVRV